MWKINSDFACRVCLLLWNFFVSAFVSVVQYEVALTTLVKRTVCNVTFVARGNKLTNASNIAEKLDILELSNG